MTNVNALLSQRLNKNEKTSKMAEMAKQSASGNLSSFTGLFNPIELQEGEKQLLESILEEYATSESKLPLDLQALTAITTEVKAISNQAALLHGERIKKAQEILKKYREGAFTAWLVATYGNRQTPYNLLQYYEFYIAMPKGLQLQIEGMPRQAVYTLASRPGSLEQKRELVERYKGETKTELLILIRECFPIAEGDRRKEDVGNHAIRTLSCLLAKLVRKPKAIRKQQKAEILALLEEIQMIVSYGGFMIGTMELIVILCVILLLFGGKKLPEFARNLGKGIREFRKATQGESQDEIEIEAEKKDETKR